MADTKFTPVAVVPFVPRNPAVARLFPKGVPVQPYVQQPTDDSIMSVFPSDIIPDAVKNLTGSNTAEFVSSFITPNTFGKALRKAPDVFQLDVYHGPKKEYGVPQVSELAKYKGADAQGFGFYLTSNPVTALGHSHTFNVKHADLPDEVIPTLLNRTAPLGFQGKGVLEKLESGLQGIPDNHPFAVALHSAKRGDGYNSVRGEQFYNKLSEEYSKTIHTGNIKERLSGGKQLASMHLQSLGIPGASYGGGNRNFVIWDQPLLDRMAWDKMQPDLTDILLTPRGAIHPGYNKPKQ